MFVRRVHTSSNAWPEGGCDANIYEKGGRYVRTVYEKGGRYVRTVGAGVATDGPSPSPPPYPRGIVCAGVGTSGAEPGLFAILTGSMRAQRSRFFLGLEKKKRIGKKKGE